MVSHTIDGHVTQYIVVSVIDLRIRIKIAIVHSCHPCLIPIPDGHVYTIGFGRLQILILTTLDRQVGRIEVSRYLTVRNGHQCDHILHLIIISCHGDVQSPTVILHTQRYIVGGLGFQVLISQIQIGAVHVSHITIVQFLRGRCLEPLTPGGSDTEVAHLRHRRQLWCQMPAKLLISVETQSSCDIQPRQRIELILHI